LGMVIFVGINRQVTEIQSRRDWENVLTTQEIEIVRRIMDNETPSVADDQGTEIRSLRQRIELSSLKALRRLLIDANEVTVAKRIGGGSFGDVYAGSVVGVPVAIKMLRSVQEETIRSFRAEIILTSSLRSPFIINFIGNPNLKHALICFK